MTKTADSTMEIADLAEKVLAIFYNKKVPDPWDSVVTFLKPGDTYWRMRDYLAKYGDPMDFRLLVKYFDKYFVTRFRQAQGAGNAKLPDCFRELLKTWLDEEKSVNNFFKRYPQLGLAMDWNLSEFANAK